MGNYKLRPVFIRLDCQMICMGYRQMQPARVASMFVPTDPEALTESLHCLHISYAASAAISPGDRIRRPLTPAGNKRDICEDMYTTHPVCQNQNELSLSLEGAKRATTCPLLTFASTPRRSFPRASFAPPTVRGKLDSAAQTASRRSKLCLAAEAKLHSVEGQRRWLCTEVADSPRFAYSTTSLVNTAFSRSVTAKRKQQVQGLLKSPSPLQADS